MNKTIDTVWGTLMAVSLHNKRKTTYAELVPCIPDKCFFYMQQTNELRPNYWKRPPASNWE